MTNDGPHARPNPGPPISRRRVLVALGIAAAAAPLSALPDGRPGPARAAAAAEAPATPPYDAIVGLI
ncbi:twin-arginine translocation signal domain-containing protein [Isoptericola sp. BMS4]|uniref:twin-arginine translocation signal domain-containing protein n=1 Tax=Isoptericola sp. BMS4 TaxID=2527875 RepID=UPI0014227B48